VFNEIPKYVNTTDQLQFMVLHGILHSSGPYLA